MKKVIAVLVVVAVCMTASYRSFAQKYFAGTVTFEIKYEGDIDPQKHVPSEITYTIFENKMKRTDSGSGLSRVIIQDGDAVTITYLFDVLGYGRIGRLASKEEILKDRDKVKRSYVERTDSKTICGIECKGYDVTVVFIDEEEEEEDYEKINFIVYTTKEIGKDDNINIFENPGLSGYPLYQEIEKKGVKTIVQAKEVKKGKVKAVDFLVPSDYRISKTDEEWEAEIEKLNQWGEENKNK